MKTKPILLRALNKELTERTPLWLMRQAGRYLPEYRDIRARYEFLQMIAAPDVACEITLQPLRRYPQIDAAIIFADILPLIDAMGLGLSFTAGIGPRFSNPVRSAQDVDKLRKLCPEEDISYTMEALRLTKAELSDDKTLLGFSGSPFTLACYAIEGRGNKGFPTALEFMEKEPCAWSYLLEKISLDVVAYLVAQVKAGADGVQLFDSWAGNLSAERFKSEASYYAKEIIRRFKNECPDTPIIYFSTGTGKYMDELLSMNADVLSVDHQTDLSLLRKQAEGRFGIQGNLDPELLLSGGEEMRSSAKSILETMKNYPGYVFNLGHGVIKETHPDTVAELLELLA